jgi:NitT/TauT family transport system ATP-binding protein
MTRLHFNDVCMTYPGERDGIIALSGVSLDLESGESVAIIGPSGCGKSTLLMVAAGLATPTSGTVNVDDEVVVSPRATTAFIQQDLGLLPWKTVLANAALGLQLRGVPRDRRKVRVLQALERVGLVDFASCYPAQLSGGMRQRLAFARAIALDCDILLMDEPLSALDALSREALQETLLQLHASQGYTQVLVTHSIAEAVFLGRRIVVMSPRPGRIVGVIDNPSQGSIAFRDSDAFVVVERAVRLLLERAVTQGGDV